MDLQRQSSKRTFTAKFVFTGEKLLENKVVTIQNGLIQSVEDSLNLEKYSHVETLGEGIICPGFIDLQLNGCGGVAFTESTTLETLEIMYQTQRKFGTTSFLPTIITSKFEKVMKGLEIVK